MSSEQRHRDSEMNLPTSATYRHLDDILKSLGLSRSDTEEAMIYRHVARGAILVLPRVEASESVEPRHWIAVRNALEAKGIAPAAIFADLMQDALEAAPASPTSSE